MFFGGNYFLSSVIRILHAGSGSADFFLVLTCYKEKVLIAQAVNALKQSLHEIIDPTIHTLRIKYCTQLPKHPADLHGLPHHLSAMSRRGRIYFTILPSCFSNDLNDFTDIHIMRCLTFIHSLCYVLRHIRHIQLLFEHFSAYQGNLCLTK